MSSYSSYLKFLIQALGENENTWGDDKLNNALKALEEAAGAVTTVPILGVGVTLDSTNGSVGIAGHFRFSAHILTPGVGVGARTVTLPLIAKQYLFLNQTAYTQTLSTGSGTTFALGAGILSSVLVDASGNVVGDDASTSAQTYAANALASQTAAAASAAAADASADAADVSEANAAASAAAATAAAGSVQAGFNLCVGYLY